MLSVIVSPMADVSAYAVEDLIHRSLPRPPMHWMGLMTLGAVGMAIGAVWAGSVGAGGDITTMLSIMLAMLVAVMFIAGTVLSRRVRRERARIMAVDELVQLRRWDAAEAGVVTLLSQPMRSMVGRIQALIFLVSVLVRRGRFADAVSVQEHILEQVRLDEVTTFGLKLGRAMALLHEERLFDADRAINELRRLVPDESQEFAGRGGLALVEIYRDVKTGHPSEALSLLQRYGKPVREQLGHRAADVYALAARACDLLEETAQAQQWYTKATLLAPVRELHRYPEVRALADRYVPAPAPRGAP